MTKTLKDSLIEACEKMKGKRFRDKSNGKEYQVIEINLGEGDMLIEYKNEPRTKGNYGMKYHLHDEPIDEEIKIVNEREIDEESFGHENDDMFQPPQHKR